MNFAAAKVRKLICKNVQTEYTNRRLHKKYARSIYDTTGYNLDPLRSEQEKPEKTNQLFSKFDWNANLCITDHTIVTGQNRLIHDFLILFLNYFSKYSISTYRSYLVSSD